MDISSFYNQLPVLVTGGCGFIGSHLVKLLVCFGAHVTVIDDLSTGLLENLASVQDNITFVRGSVTDFATCMQHTAGKKVVFHLAAFISVPGSMRDPHACHQTNIIGTLNMLEAARLNGVKRFVFSSSAAVYGAYEGTCHEQLPCTPTSAYGWSKYYGELLCAEYHTLHQLSTVALRYFNVYGAGQRADSPYAAVRATFTQKMKDNQPITIFGDGLQTRDFVCVDEVVQTNLLVGALSDEALPSFESFNVGTGQATTILQLVQDLKNTFPEFNQSVKFAPARPGDVRHSLANCSKLRTIRQHTF